MREIFNFIKALLCEKLEYELVSRAKLIKQFRNDSSPCCYDWNMIFSSDALTLLFI